jgi:hypothetical protein
LSDAVKDFINNDYNLNFLGRLHGILADRWETILRKLDNIHLNDSSDGIIWGLSGNKFSLRNQFMNIWREIYPVPKIS